MLSYHSYHIYSTWKSIQVGGGDLKFEVIVWNGGGGWGGGGGSHKGIGQEKVYISCNYSCTIAFLLKILLVKLKYFNIQYA